MGNATKVAHIRKYGKTAMKWNDRDNWLDPNSRSSFQEHNERKTTDLQIIRDMLKMGTATETGMQSQLGLPPEEFDRHRRHLLQRGLAIETIDPSRDFLLQPTSAGEALMHLIDTVESIEGRKQQKERPPTKEQSSVALSPNMAVTVMLMRNKLFQGYVLEQAEAARLEAQLKYDGDDEELMKEHKQREQKLGLLQEFLGVFAHLVNKSGNS